MTYGMIVRFLVPSWRRGSRFFSKKGISLALVLGTVLSSGFLQAESVRDDPDFDVILPIPELPAQLLLEIPEAKLLETLEEGGTLGETIPVVREMPPAAPQEALLTETGDLAQAFRPMRRASAPESDPVEPEIPPVWQGVIPGLMEPLTQQYIGRYSRAQGLAWLNAIMRRGGPYLAFIRREIEIRNLPPELLYLPVIESAYISSAVSKSGATGLWQFMKNSIAPYDMKITEWVDERMDFWKSTIGALRKLEENYRQLGDWALALAAYNSGLGGLTRIMQKTGIKDYWVLSAKKELALETIHFVPKLLAISYIMSNPRRFGVDPVWPEDPEWTRVPVGRTVDLGLLAVAAGLDQNDLKRANRELLFNVTPPDPDYQLKVRAADAAVISEVLARHDLALIKYYFHTVKSGDTLSALALQYGISVDHILNSNPGTQAKYLKIGSRLLIPAFKDLQEPPNTGPRTPTGENQFEGVHLVKPGETLWSIARSYNIAPEVLANANGMGLHDILHEGKHLKTPIR
ncbi:MAG: LysM peptidoglycan-binding domain-containing protein [Treponema sp.]|jgi:membrane-bound lytic murein transglycosylase D|nr:LysM peptidoglycan-binding domain-containing protein [Treponema sp.]